MFPNKPYNRLLSVNDYTPLGWTRRKQWEVDCAFDTVFNHLPQPDKADVLGVGAGTEHTIFRLSNYVNRVWATDLYIGNDVWAPTTAPLAMLTTPEAYAPAGEVFDLKRIVVQHMDALDLRYPDNSFDAIFSSGSIEHFGGFSEVSRAAAEIGRVLKPGGIASISTEFKLSGQGYGWQGILLFTPELLQRHIIEPSGLELIDTPNWHDGADAETLATVWPLDDIVLHGSWPTVEGVLSSKGFTFTSVHLALRKPYAPT